MARPGGGARAAPAARHPKSSRRGTRPLLCALAALAFALAALQFAMGSPHRLHASDDVGVAPAPGNAGTAGRSAEARATTSGSAAREASAGGGAARRPAATHADLSPPPPSRGNVTRTIWQTSRNATLPPEAYEYVRTWTDKNPGWEYRLLTDADVEDFFRTDFIDDPRVYSAFRALPLGVMKADMFRVAIVYRRGGVYADIDTECVVPIDTWWPKEEGVDGDDECGAHVGLEGVSVCNWALAAPRPGHPVFRRALYRIVEGVESYDERTPMKVSKRLVLTFTGPVSLTRAVAEALGMEDIAGPGTIMRRVHRGRFGAAGKDEMSGADMMRDDRAQARAKEMQLCIKEQAFFKRDAVKHHYGAMLWKDSATYKSWKKEAASMAA